MELGDVMGDKANIPEREENSLRHEAESVDAAGSARRRVLKAGAGLAPVVVLTLASRPVLAGQCKSPSAWGSAQLAATSQAASGNQIRSWTVSNWKNNTTSDGLSQPWAKLGVTEAWTVGDVAAKGIVVPGGATSGTKMVDFLGDGGMPFPKLIVVAQLNTLLLPEIQNCVSLATLKTMASGTYSPPHLSVAWTSSEIVTYLIENGITNL
jgi:hypothetical protein